MVLLPKLQGELAAKVSGGVLEAAACHSCSTSLGNSDLGNRLAAIFQRKETRYCLLGFSCLLSHPKDPAVV